MRNLGKLTLVLALVSGMNGVEQVAGGGADQPQPPEFRVPTPAGAASFGGVVSDASGKAAGGVEVRFLPGHYHNAPKPFETKSDQAGRYVVLLEYEFHGGGMGWSGPTSGNNLILARDGERNLVVMQVFDKTPSNLDLTLQPGIAFSGSVKGTTGSPLTGVTIEMHFVEHKFNLNDISLGTLKLDSRGSFFFSAWPQGREFNGAITAKGYCAAKIHVIEMEAKTNRYEFASFVLKKAGQRVTGRVFLPDGKPAAGVHVKFWGEAEEGDPQVDSDKEGRFNFESVSEGACTVYANVGNDFYGTTKCHGGDTNVEVRMQAMPH
jgi:hypothetical protein